MEVAAGKLDYLKRDRITTIQSIHGQLEPGKIGYLEQKLFI